MALCLTAHKRLYMKNLKSNKKRAIWFSTSKTEMPYFSNDEYNYSKISESYSS